jgi:alpha,alpha-trehalose phosphorylase
MYVPYDEVIGLHPQDQDFLAHRRWDFERTPPDHYPLLLHYPYVKLYAAQVVKQADLVLAMHWRGDAFTPEQKRRNFDHYEGVCVRDSSLSACTQSVIAAEVGHLDLALAYLREAALMDLDDLDDNTADGLHMASLAGALIATVGGFGGLRDRWDQLEFRPRLPRALTRVRHKLPVRGVLLEVEVRHDATSYRLARGERMELLHWDERVVLEGDAPVTLAIPPAPELPPPAQPPGREPRYL